MNGANVYLTRMIVFLAVVVVVVAVLSRALVEPFLASVGLNTVILAVAVFGVFYIFRQVLLLRPERLWLERMQERRGDTLTVTPQSRVLRAEKPAHPGLLAPLARLVDSQGQAGAISAPTMRAVLDGIGSRLDEKREISRYLIGLLIFLGLLGTFWGLLRTVGAVSGVINELSGEGLDVGALFERLREPLGGMGTAFSASLFGLASSLSLGFLELQATQAQNRFYNDVEDWAASLTRFEDAGGALAAVAAPVAAAAPAMPAFASPAQLQALTEQTAENLERLQAAMVAVEGSRRLLADGLAAIAERIAAMVDQMGVQQRNLTRLVEGQADLRPLLGQLAEAAQAGAFGIDDETRGHLRNLDVMSGRVLEEMAANRSQSVHEIRTEIRALSRLIAALSEQPVQA